MRLDDGELHGDLQHLSDGHEIGGVSLAGNSDVQLAAVEIRIDEIASVQMTLGEGFQVPALALLTNVQRGVEVLERGLDLIVQQHFVDPQLLGVQPDVLQVVLQRNQTQFDESDDAPGVEVDSGQTDDLMRYLKRTHIIRIRLALHFITFYSGVDSRCILNRGKQTD